MTGLAPPTHDDPLILSLSKDAHIPLPSAPPPR